MPSVKVKDLTMHYEQEGQGEPLILIPYLAADCACYAFQVAEYAKHFTCISIDLRGMGASDKPGGTYSTELFADDVAGFMQALGIPAAHVSGLSLGAAAAMWLGAKHPGLVKTLSLHSGWTKSDPFLTAVVQGWRALARGLGNVQEMVIQGIFPWCFTPELYAARPEYVDSLAAFVRSRPATPLEAFMHQSDAVLGHDAEAALGRIAAPTQVTFGRHDLVTSTRFAGRMTGSIRGSELVVFEDCSHAPIYEQVEAFNRKTLAFLLGHAG